jgi:hypothetical protein
LNTVTPEPTSPSSSTTPSRDVILEEIRSHISTFQNNLFKSLELLPNSHAANGAADSASLKQELEAMKADLKKEREERLTIETERRQLESQVSILKEKLKELETTYARELQDLRIMVTQLASQSQTTE